MTVNFEVRDRIAIITLNRPEARNAVSQQLAEDLEAAIDRLEADDALWIGILCGNGPAFCAGADLKAIASGEARLTTERGGFAGLVRRVRTKPLIAAVEGPAVAGGTEIVLSCDLVVASTTACFGLPEVKRSLVANAGGLFRLPRALPTNVAMEMALTGDDLDAEAAHRHGLVNRLVQPGHALATAVELAEAVNANAPLAVRASRRVVLAARLLEDDEAFEVAANATREVFRTEDFREGPRAFVEKRSPIWTGR
jgi:enoyl-CoA hydratase|tara:strand:- start:47 stop:808 length:762 start_codon:yes stop_codon:yes gene_type:complete